VPLPDEAQSSPPGVALASAITSATVCASTDLLTTSRLVTSAARKIGWKSLTVS
jgi:hypothetical protein